MTMFPPKDLSLLDRTPWPRCPAPFNMAAHVLAHADRVPDKIALAILGPARAERWPYQRLAQAVRGVGTGLLAAGLRPGDRVLLRLGNTPDFPVAYLGAIAVGLVPVPTAAQLTGEEVAKLCEITRPAAILRDPEVASCAHPREIPRDEMRGWHDLPPCEFAMGAPDRPAYMIFTSGTSAAPRAVVHAHRAIWARGMMREGWYGMGPEDRILHAGGFNWSFTLGTGLMDPWSLGATALIPAPGTKPQMLPLLLKRHDATLFAAAPGVYRQMLRDQSQIDLPKLRHGLVAGESLPPSLRGRFEEVVGRPVYEAYGLSECSTFLSAAPDSPARTGAIGTAQPGRRIALLDPDTNTPVPLGHEGEIAVDARDPGLMLGYFEAPEATAARMRDGWFCTGDMAVMAADGQITYRGRTDDMMNAGGFRVSPAEVEACLQTLPGIDAVAVTEVEIKPDVRVIAAFYTGAAPLEEAILTAHAEAHLARYKQPRLYRHLDALPVNANGKIARRLLREQSSRSFAADTASGT